ncbi:SBBP repeat-containing protein, partial [Myxococcota bacterium]|nr:SBBP repeat-containing protein [Myxococcota bacterium]
GIDASSNIIVTGFTTGALGGVNNGNTDIFVRKMSSSGAVAWTSQWGSSALDQGTGVAVDSVGNIYISGLTQGDLGGSSSQGSTDMFLMKITSGGVASWTRVIGTASDDQAWAVTCRDDNAIYVAGHSDGTFPGHTNHGGQDAVVVKYDSAGTQLASYTGGGSGNDYCNSMALQPTSGIYCTGTTDGSLPGAPGLGLFDFFVLHFAE